MSREKNLTVLLKVFFKAVSPHLQQRKSRHLFQKTPTLVNLHKLNECGVCNEKLYNYLFPKELFSLIYVLNQWW